MRSTTNSGSGRQAPRRGLSLLETIIVIAIVAVLLALLAPAVMAAREAALRCLCANNLKQIGVGMQNYESGMHVFPPGDTDVPWTVSIAPYIEQGALYDAYDKEQDPYHPNNAPLGAYPIKVFACPADKLTRLEPSQWVCGNYAANDAVLNRCNSSVKITDGTSHTCMAVETASERGLAYITGPTLTPGVESTLHQKAFNVLFADGSVRPVRFTISPDVMRAIATPNAGDDPGGEF